MVSKKNALGKGLGALLENAKTDITSKAGIETNAQAGLTSVSYTHLTLPTN